MSIAKSSLLPMLMAGSARAWESPELCALARLQSHATFQTFPTLQSARGGPANSPWRLSLDGEWDFRLEENPAAASSLLSDPKKTAKAKWNAINVPGNW